MIRFALASLLSLVASLAQAAGFQHIEIPVSGALSPPLKGAVWYPCAKPPGEMSFRNVSVPVQLWGSERGGDGVTPESVRDIAAWLPTRPDFRVVPNSQHFDFLGPCPAELAKSRPQICDDEPGFDRLAFHKEFNAAVIAFFREHLTDAARP